MPASRPRATSLDDFQGLLADFVSDESFRRGLALELRTTDVVISPFAKCGTTWLQQMVHTLRTGGDMDFDDISRVVPWIETSHDLGIPLDTEQRAHPRAFKSHLPWEPMPRGGRYLIAVRSPDRALISFYRFMSGWLIEPGTIPLDEFAHWWINRDRGRDYWTHFVSWWQRRDDDDTLIVAFELMKRHPRIHVERVAEFAGIPADEKLIDLTLESSSLEFMLAHADRFDDLGMRTLSETRLGLPPGSESAKVKAELPEEALVLSEEVVSSLEAKWQQVVTPACGLSDYDDALRILKRDLS